MGHVLPPAYPETAGNVLRAARYVFPGVRLAVADPAQMRYHRVPKEYQHVLVSYMEQGWYTLFGEESASSK